MTIPIIAGLQAARAGVLRRAPLDEDPGPSQAMEDRWCSLVGANRIRPHRRPLYAIAPIVARNGRDAGRAQGASTNGMSMTDDGEASGATYGT